MLLGGKIFGKKSISQMMITVHVLCVNVPDEIMGCVNNVECRGLDVVSNIGMHT